VLLEGEEAKIDAELLKMAHDAFMAGAGRRGLTLANFVLRRNPAAEDAWSMKEHFLRALDFSGALETVRRRGTPPPKRWWWPW
jgi:hypothetical protein